VSTAWFTRRKSVTASDGEWSPFPEFAVPVTDTGDIDDVSARPRVEAGPGGPEFAAGDDVPRIRGDLERLDGLGAGAPLTIETVEFDPWFSQVPECAGSMDVPPRRIQR